MISFHNKNKQVPSKPCALKGMRWVYCKFHHNTSVSIEVGSGRQWSGVNTSFKRTLRWNNLYLNYRWYRSHVFYAVRSVALLRFRRKCSKIHVALLPFLWYDVFEGSQENEWKCVEIGNWHNCMVSLKTMFLQNYRTFTY